MWLILYPRSTYQWYTSGVKIQKKAIIFALIAGLLAVPLVIWLLTRSPLSLEQKVGQMFMLGFNGIKPDYYITKALKQRNFGGVILLGYNIEQPNQLKELTSDLTGIPETKPFIAVDQEGNLVARVKFEPTAKVSQSDLKNGEEAYDTAFKRGAYLKEMGINLNLAPVVDLATSESANIWSRAFRKDHGIFGDAMIRGCNDAGIYCVVKHFPSYGNFSGDVEKEIPRKELSAGEVAVFKEALKNAKFLMISPVIATNIDPDNPAPISEKAIKFIRENLGFKGLIITDDVEMVSIRSNYNPVQFAADAIKAGVDMVLFSGNPQDAADAYDLVVEKVESGEISGKRINESVKRILGLKKSL